MFHLWLALNLLYEIIIFLSVVISFFVTVGGILYGVSYKMRHHKAFTLMWRKLTSIGTALFFIIGGFIPLLIKHDTASGFCFGDISLIPSFMGGFLMGMLIAERVVSELFYINRKFKLSY